jgi:protein tyrosine/serine phosphatase
MPYYLERYKIKTLLNLRGEQKNKSWYKNEKKITKEHNVTLITYKMSSRKYLDFNKTSKLVKILKDAKKPILIHCEGGADRTSLASALYVYAIQGKSANRAREEFSFIYGHLPLIRPQVTAMDRSFDNYVKEIVKLEKEK